MKGLAILYHPSALWPFSGSERRFAQTTKRLMKYGVSFDAIEPYPPLHQFMPVFHNYYCVKLFSRDRIYASLFEWIIRGLGKAKELCRKNRYDFVYATNENVYNVLLGCLVSKLFSLPLVNVIHHLRWIDYTNPQSYNKLRFNFIKTYWLMRKYNLNFVDSLLRSSGANLETVLLRRGHTHITVSKTVADQLRQIGVNGRIFVNGNGIDFNYIDAMANGENDYTANEINNCTYDAICVGRLDEGKGTFNLINTWRLLVDMVPEAKLAIVGKGALYEKARQYVERLGMQNNVVFLGFLQEPELFPLLKSCKVFIKLSTMEGWGLTIGEALACGLPVITYKIPTICENFSSCRSVIFVKVDDIKQTAESIVEMLKLNDAERNKISNVSRSFIQKFTWEKVARNEYKALADLT